MGAPAALNPASVESDDGMAGLSWGPQWLRHAISWRWVWGVLSLSALLVLPLLVLGWERAALLLWCLLMGIGLLLAWRRWQRLREQVQQQLPAFIDGMVRMVLLGHATPSAFLLASAAVKPPLQTTLSQAAAFAKAGMPVDQALAAASRHWGLEAFSLLAAILQVGGRFGGRVDNLLERVAHFMRDQQQAKQELHALSAEVRLSAWVLSLLPLVVGGGIIVTNANYFMQLWTDTGGASCCMPPPACRWWAYARCTAWRGWSEEAVWATLYRGWWASWQLCCCWLGPLWDCGNGARRASACSCIGMWMQCCSVGNPLPPCHAVAKPCGHASGCSAKLTGCWHGWLRRQGSRWWHRKTALCWRNAVFAAAPVLRICCWRAWH